MNELSWKYQTDQISRYAVKDVLHDECIEHTSVFLFFWYSKATRRFVLKCQLYLKKLYLAKKNLEGTCNHIE